MAGDDNRAFYCLLGTHQAGLYDLGRPANTMLGAPKALLPIVVITTNRQDAETIWSLHDAIFKLTAPEDAHTMVYLLQHEPATTIDVKLQVAAPIFAVRCGVETGVYIGYDWSSIERFVTPPPGRKGYAPRWEGFSRLSDALIFMLKKPGVNIPLVPAGVPYPAPPPRTTKAVRFDFSALPPPEQDDKVPATPSKRAASPVKSAIAPSSRAASPVKGSAAAGPSASTSPPAHEVDELTTVFREIFNATPALEFLRRLLRPPPTMGGSVHPRLPPLMLGAQADSLFMSSGLNAYELLTLLQVRVHARTVESFTHHIGLMLGWSTRDAARLWEVMRFPEV